MVAAIVLSIALFFAIVEAVLRVAAPHLPIRLHRYLHSDVFTLVQTSKSDFIPVEYIAIFGDSYAQGMGDWWYESAGQVGGSGAYHSAHVIFDQTERDVISFGVAGAGSFDGLVYYPIRTLERISRRGIDIEPPAEIVIYFYEGNDLDNNLSLVNQYGAEQIMSGKTIEDMKAQLTRFATQRRKESTTIIRQLYESLYVGKLVGALLHDLTHGTGQDPAPDAAPIPTRFEVGPSTVVPPQGLQSPALGLTEEELDLSLLVLHASLALVRETYGDTAITIVFIPSPLTSYRIASETVAIESHGGPIRPSRRVYQRSDRICRRVADIARELGMGFHDARSSIQTVASETLVHGPRDWRHFNRLGYETLGQSVAQALTREGSRQGDCRSLY